MQHELAVTVKFDIETIRKAAYILTDELLTNEQIEQRIINREKIIFNADKLFGKEAIKMCLGLTSIILIEEKEENTNING